MQVPRQQERRSNRLQVSGIGRQAGVLAVLVALAMAMLAGCSINEQKSADNKNNKVDIKTPFGEMHVDDSKNKKVDIQTPFGKMKVNTDVDVKDTGFPVYPGATPAPRDEHDSNSANVNISSGSFALKVVAVKFESDDPPDKVLAFYRDKVKAYGGKFLECRGVSIEVHADYKDNDEKELSCGNDSHHSDSTELKAGTPDRQHIVSVKSRGNGSEFALVYVNKSGGKEGEL
jgi:hypothetical protein